MTPILAESATFRIHVTAAAPAAPLAILSVASVLGIEPQQAADRLASLPTVLAENVAPPAARRLSALLAVLGMQVRLDPTLSAAEADPSGPVDLAIQPVEPVGPEALSRLAGRLDWAADDVRLALGRPGGLVLPKRSAEQAENWRRALRRERSLRLVASAGPTATYDAFRIPGVQPPTADLLRLGLGRCATTGAIASGMNHATATHLARRNPGRILILDRAFQRYDLFLLGAPGVAPDDLERFLASRPTAQRSGGHCGPRRLDADLPHRSALEFAADYASIGLEVGLSLRGFAGENA